MYKIIYASTKKTTISLSLICVYNDLDKVRYPNYKYVLVFPVALNYKYDTTSLISY